MRVAVFHDYLNQFGGAERVLRSILDLFPDADVYTLLYDKEKTRGMFEDRRIVTSFLDNKLVQRHHRMFIPLMPFASEWMKMRGPYDVVISSTAGYAKGFGRRKRLEKEPFHISYCHSPLRYAWEIDYLKNLPFSPQSMSKSILRPVARWIREWDRRASTRVNVFIVNSRYIKGKVRAYYGREAQVVYPPVLDKVFYHEPESEVGDYYLMAGRLLYYKVFDLGIRAFNRLRIPLKVIGRGPEAEKLKNIADPSVVEFIPYVSDEELRGWYNRARGFIFPQVEDFGLVAAEAQACGTPVVGYNAGGGAEIVENKKTGILFDDQNVESLIKAVREAERTRFDRSYIARRAGRFSESKFREDFMKVVQDSGF